MGSATPAMDCLTGSGNPPIHRLTAWGHWAPEPLQCTTSLPRGSGQCNSCNALLHILGAVGMAIPAWHGPAALGQRVVGLLQYTASLPGGSGQCNSCNALSHSLGAVGSATPTLPHCLGAMNSGTLAIHLRQLRHPMQPQPGTRLETTATVLTVLRQWHVPRASLHPPEPAPPSPPTRTPRSEWCGPVGKRFDNTPTGAAGFTV